jgi:hypothetical protein
MNDPNNSLTRKVFLAEIAAVNEHLADQEKAATTKAKTALGPLEAKARALHEQQHAEHRAEVLRQIAHRLAHRATLYGDSQTVNEVIKDLLRLADEERDEREAQANLDALADELPRMADEAQPSALSRRTPTTGQPARACNGCGTPAHPYLNCDQAQQANATKEESA